MWSIIGIIAGVIVLGFLIILLVAWPVMWLWNYVMPDIFGLQELTYWQAWAITILCSILFKSTNFNSKS